MITSQLVEVRSIINETKQRAQDANLFYVLLIWDSEKSELASTLEYRRGYFDNFPEAEIFKNMLVETVERYNFKYQLYSNCGLGADGNL